MRLRYMNIYDKDDRTIFASVPITKDAVHEEELMASNFVRLSWYDTRSVTLPVGSYIVPFSDGVKYRLFDPYIPKSEKHAKFKYEPEFQHPVMWLGRIPFIHLEGDTTSWETATKRYDWTYSGPPTEIAERVVTYINWLSSVMPSFGEVFGRGWTKRVEGDLPPNAGCSFATLDIMSAAAEIATQFECEYHFDFEQKVFHLGKISYNRYGGDPYRLRCGDNVGVVSVGETKEPYANCFVVNGGTKNLSKLDSEGGYVQVTQRLTLDEEKYPDSIIDTRDNDNEPILVRELVFDNIYPKLELYIYNPRERLCWYKTSDGERVETDSEDRYGRQDISDGKYYKVYAKWYVRLAYLSDGEWKDYELTEERMIKDRKPMLSFEVNQDYQAYTSSLAGKEYEVVYFEDERHETMDNVNDEDFVAHAGDYRIEFVEEDNYVMPSMSIDGLCPKGDVTPDKHNNKASMYNVVVDDAYKEVAREELYDEAMRTIRRLSSDLNTYTFPSNPIVFKDYNPNLYVGQTVVYDDGQDLNHGSSYTLETHVRKLVTRVDKPYIQTITVGNEKRKGTVTTMKDQIQTFISGGYGGGGNGGGIGGTTITEDQFEQLIANYGSKFFLSKVNDDVAQGVIGFLKGAWFGVKNWFIDSDGNANLNNTTVNGLLKAYNATINKVKSSNYNGDGIMDTGWQIINDFEGTDSYAVFDRLYIRKKATFEELEVRKWTGIGGNFIASPSAGVIWMIDYFDAEGNELGYEYKKVPWTPFGRLMILFTPHNANNRYLGRVKRIKRPLTDAEKALVRTIRCYMYCDDGSTQTDNIHQDPSTETMNGFTVGAQMRCQTINKAKLDYEGGVWKGKHFSNHYWWRMVQGVGMTQMSDGRVHDYVDFWVNLGNQEATRANEDAGSDWPEVGDTMVQMGHRTNKQLQHVIALETSTAQAPAIREYKGVNFWDLTSHEKTRISPTAGNIFYATKFHIETEYEDVLIPADRGAWTQGMACAYYDRVSHNGSLWLCIAPNGTTIEPGDATAEQRSVWQRQVSKGDKGETSFKSQVFKRSATKPAKPTGGSFSSPVPSGWSDGIPSGTDTIWMTTRIFSTDGQSPQQAAWTDVQLLSDTESFDVEFAKKTSDGNPPAAPNGHNQHGGDQTQVWFDPSLDTTTDFTTMVWMAERTKADGVWGSWKITKIKGEDGGFKSRVFKRTNTDISSQRPTGGSYASPYPTSGGWTDGIPSGEAALWSSVCTFWVDGTNSGWSLPAKETDTSDIDIEYSKSATKPNAPTGSTPHSDHSSEGWYDPALHHTADWANMIWRAERKINNGAYSSGWVISKIKGEKGVDGIDATTTALKYTGPLATGATAPTVATYKNFTWTDNIPTQTEEKPNVYVGVWEYTAGTTLDINTKAPKSISLFAHYGKTGTSVTITSESVTYQASSSGTTTPTGTWSTTVPSVDQGKFLWTKTYVKYSDGTETLSYAVAYRGIDGTNPIFADIENEMDSVACTSDGKTIKEYVRKVFVSLWKGSTKQTLTGITVSGAPTGATVTTNTTEGSVRMTIPASTSLAETTRMSIVLSASGISNQTVYFTLNGVRCGADGAIYTLVPTSNEVIRKKDGTIIPSNNIYCRVIKIVGKEYTTPSRSEYTLKVKIDGGSEQNYDLDGYEASAIHQSLEFILYIDGNVADRETVPAVEDGDNMTITSQSVTYQVSTSGTTVPTGTWSTTVPSVPQGQFLWTKTYVLYADGTSTTSYSVSYNAKNGIDGINGNDGKNGTSIVPVPNALVINQEKTTTGAKPLSNIAEYIFPVARDGASILPITTLTITESKYCDSTVENDSTYGKHVKITGIWKLQTNDDGSYKTSGGNYIKYTGSSESKVNDKWVWKYAPSGSVTFTASATTSGSQTLSATISVPFACSLLGTYFVDIEDDMKTEVAQKVTAEIKADGVLTTTNFDNKYNNASWGVKQDITKTINELKGDGTYDRTTGFTNSRLSTAEANISSLTTSLGNTYTKTETATYVSQQISTNNQSYYTKSETSSLINTSIRDNNNNYYTKTETSNLVSSEVKAGVKEVSSLSLSDSGSWEQGSTDGESSGKTYEQIKVDSTARIRTVGLWSITNDVRVTYNSSYQVGIVYFTAEKLVASTGWQGWFSGGDNTLSVPDDAHYVAVLLAKNGAAISTSEASSARVKIICEAVATKSYADQTANSYSIGVKSEIEGKLADTGIDINQESITIRGNHIYFEDSYGNPANIWWDNESGKYVFGYLRASDGADLNGSSIHIGGTATSSIQVCGGSNSTLRLGVDASDVVSGSIKIGTTTHSGSAVFNNVATFNDDATFNDPVNFYDSAQFYDNVEISDELKVSLRNGSHYIRVYFDASGNVCLDGSFSHPASRYKLVCDGDGFLKLTN